MTDEKYLYAGRQLAKAFPNAADYRIAISPGRRKLREGGPLRAALPFSERHLQCVWFNPDLRPKRLRDLQGEVVRVVDPGRWNLESGPDFLDAVFEIESVRRRICGDVEIHIDPADWIGHGHQSDPRYSNVCAHVTYFKAPLPSEKLPPGALQISLQKELMSNPYFAFENIDVTAYPYELQSKLSPCAEILAKWSREKKEALLEAAGEERMLRKAEQFQNLVNDLGLEQALYTQLMRALGYKQNAAGFRYMAENLPVALLREESDGDIVKAYALLLGVAGLLPTNYGTAWDRESKVFVRQLWDHWWRLRSRWEHLAMEPDHWCTSGIRPQNRVERRLMAAAAFFAGRKPIAADWTEQVRNSPDECIRLIVSQLTSLKGEYWDRRLAWAGKVQTSSVSLVGESRASAIVSNVFIPFAAHLGLMENGGDRLIRQMPPEPINSIMRQTAHLLLGASHAPAIYAAAARRQGLLQIFHDFCLPDRSGCRECELPQLLV